MHAAANNFSTIELLRVFSDRLSHQFRTPLSVALGVVDDLNAGFELKKIDLQDAQAALHKILESLEFIKDFSQRSSQKKECFQLKELLLQLLKNEPTIDFQPMAENTEIVADEKLLFLAFRYLFRWIVKNSTARPETKSVILKIINMESGKLAVSVQTTETKSSSKTLCDLALSQHGLESLGLLFAAAVFGAEDVESLVEWGPEETMEIIFVFSSRQPLMRNAD